ncbi:ADAM10 isoform 17 [Pongo abelii]|uniref:ADAM10 isoform 17 n=1 Tax=Pongo abelii TaxID=9601 RepID=A0A2J8VCA3_PONAB|nr:ADAM10 isoform 17 [Pongo abelii]
MVLLRVLILLLSWAAGMGALARWRIPKSSPPPRPAAQTRGKLCCLRLGSCIVLYPARRS